MVERRYMNRINGWAQVMAGVTANAEEAAPLESGVVRLRELHKEAGELSAQQASLTAAKQESTKKLRKILREGDALADFLRTGARAQFGPESEKMVEFGMQPFRGRKLSPEAKVKRALTAAQRKAAKAKADAEAAAAAEAGLPTSITAD
jgi:hypothetical protein